MITRSPFGDSRFHFPVGTGAQSLSQRDYIIQPRVARHELPWEREVKRGYPERVGSKTNADGRFPIVEDPLRTALDATPSELESFARATQGSSFLATLGYRIQSLRDSCSRDGADWSARALVAALPRCAFGVEMKCIDRMTAFSLRSE